ncbi:MAG: enoyl-CoA hydratase-related protein [Acidobacteriota bacterium]
MKGRAKVDGRRSGDSPAVDAAAIDAAAIDRDPGSPSLLRGPVMPYDSLLVDRDDRIAIVTVDRPQVRNALNAATIDALGLVMADLQRDERIRVVIVTGSGDKAFVAGADINELAALTPAGSRDRALIGQRVFDLVENLGKPVIAAINGYALGGGCELAMACTLRLAADTARIGQPEISLGLLPGYAGTQRLSRLVGKGKAMELMLTGELVSADEAQRIGLINRVVPAAGLIDEARRLARQLSASAPIAMHYIMSAVNRGLDMPFADACAYEATLFGLVASTDDMREGTRAFLEKRKAEFRGR